MTEDKMREQAEAVFVTPDAIPFGIITATNYEFGAYIECFQDRTLIPDVAWIDCITGKAYQFVKKDTKLLYSKDSGLPVVGELQCDVVRLAKKASDEAKQQFRQFVSRIGSDTAINLAMEV